MNFIIDKVITVIIGISIYYIIKNQLSQKKEILQRLESIEKKLDNLK